MKSKATVAIIGAGIIGVSIAYYLSRRGISDVVLLDRGRAGGGSTSAALGGFRHQFSTELSVKLSLRSISVIERFKDLTGYDPLVSHDGYIFIASTEGSLKQLERNRDLQTGLGVSVKFVSSSKLQSNYPFYDFDGFLGGTFCDRDGHASTLAVHQGFLSKSRESGAELEEFTEVVGVRSGVGGARIEVITTKGKLLAEKLVIAAGAYSRPVGRLASLDIPIEPYPRKILVTKSFTDGIPLEIPLIIDVDSTFAFGREGRGLIFSDNRPTNPGFDLVFPPNYDEDLMRIALQRIPSTRDSSISYANSGLYEMTPDAQPIVCEIPSSKGIYCCAGFAGHGFMHSPAIGELTAELIETGGTSLDISSYHIDRFSAKKGEKEKLII